MTVRVGSLRVGTPFTTRRTNRPGTVLGTGKAHRTAHSKNGVLVEMEGPDEERYIHENVYVLVERLR